jgi:hypothetical protein
LKAFSSIARRCCVRRLLAGGGRRLWAARARSACFGLARQQTWRGAMSLPYGQRAKELLQELKRSEWLPKYNVSEMALALWLEEAREGADGVVVG